MLPAADDPDRALFARLARRDESALGELIDQRCDDVSMLVARIVGEECDVDGIVEEVFWKAWVHVGQHRCSGGAWLSIIAQNEARDALRSARSGHDGRTRVRDGAISPLSTSISSAHFA